MHPIQQILLAQKQGRVVGIYSCCSANEFVLLAALERGKQRNTTVLIEATANQVNQFGGYTGMTASNFYVYVQNLIAKVGIDPSQVILGGDHLGPLPWAALPEAKAMAHAKELVYQFVLAGFTKIHLDTSMRLADDDSIACLSNDTIARRGAELCAVCEQAYAERKQLFPNAEPPVYIIGSEVPIPGGAQQVEEGVSITKPEDCLATYHTFQQAFEKHGLSDAWTRVVAMVVQPGVEFGDDRVFAYDSAAAKQLTSLLMRFPMVFEGHSTDYQTPESLRSMVRDGIAILKVGPALTFGLREALFALECIERELLLGTDLSMSNFRATLEYQMLENDQNWRNHYRGNGNQQRISRAFSFSDRARYYIPHVAVQHSIERLLKNLHQVKIPSALLSQYMPVQYVALCKGKIEGTPESLILDRIGNYIDNYYYATLSDF